MSRVATVEAGPAALLPDGSAVAQVEEGTRICASARSHLGHYVIDLQMVMDPGHCGYAPRVV